MEKEDYIKCIVVIMNFLIISDDEYSENNDIGSESNLRMMRVLAEYGYGMVSFTEHIADEPLWMNSPKEFFSNYKLSIDFYIKKLNELSNNENIKIVNMSLYGNLDKPFTF